MKGIIWGATFEVAKEKLNEIRKHYALIGEKEVHVKKSASSYEVAYECGDHWRAVSASENARGYRVNLSLVDANVDTNIVNTIISTTTTALPWNAIAYF